MKKEIATVAGIGLIGGFAASEFLSQYGESNSIPTTTDENFVQEFPGEDGIVLGTVDVWLGEVDRFSSQEFSYEELVAQVHRHRWITGNYGSLFGEVISSGEQYGDRSEYVELIQGDVRDHLLEGIDLIHLLDPESNDRIKINGERIIFEDIELLLDDPFEFHLAAGLIDKELEKFEENDPIGEFYLDHDMKDLKILSGLDLNVVVESGSFAVIPVDYLLILSRIAQQAESLGVPQPNEVAFTNHKEEDDFVGGYYDHNAKGKEFTMYVSNRTNVRSLAHEWGHYFSDVWARDESFFSFSQMEFDEAYERLYNENSSFLENSTEEYAQAFARYVIDGLDGHRSIKFGSGSNSLTNSDIYQMEYHFMKSLFGDRQFRRDGVVMRKHDEEAKINIGDAWFLYSNNDGHILRFITTYDEDGGSMGFAIASVDNASVKIIDGPIVNPNTQTTFWKIVVGSYTEDGSFQTDEGLLGESRWISDEWFSEVIVQADPQEADEIADITKSTGYSPDLRSHLASGSRKPLY